MSACIAFAVLGLLQISVAQANEPLTQPPSQTATTMTDYTSDMESAFEMARNQGRRVLLYFTSGTCGWCDEMENKVLNQPEVISYSKNFVCVKINLVKRPDVAEKFLVSSLPRTMVCAADGAPVSLRIGYSSLDEHLTWLKATSNDPPTSIKSLIENAESLKDQEKFPAAVGAALENAGVVIWFVSSEAKPFNDPTWSAHETLLELLQESNLGPRVEHYYAWQLAERWKAASAEGMLPNFIVGSMSDGLFAQLMAEGVVRDVISTRLQVPDATSACRDFAQHSRIWQVPAAPNPDLAERTLEYLLAPREKSWLGPLAELTNSERVLATTQAKTVARAWLEYNFAELDKHWDEHAPQRNIAQVIDLEWVKSERDYRKSIELRKLHFYGNSDLLLVMIDTLWKTDAEAQAQWFVSKSQVVRSPTFVMLKRDGKEYRALSVGVWRWDIHPGNAADALFAVAKKKLATAPETAGIPVILEPQNGAVCGNQPLTFRWKKPESESAGNHYYSLMANADGGVFFNQLLTEDEFKLEVRGNSSVEIWNINDSGQIGFSEIVQLIYQPEVEAAAK